MMVKTRTEMYDAPRLACLLVPWNFSLPQGLSPEEQDPKIWIRRLVNDGDNKAWGWFRENMQLFLVCARTYRLVPCGAEGHGYKIQRFRTWMKNTLGVIKVMVELTFIVLGASVASDLSSYLLGAVEEYLGVAEGDDVLSLKTYVRGPTSGGGDAVQKVKPLHGRSYESLKRFIHDREDEALAVQMSNRRRYGRARNQPSSSFVYFKSKMVSRVADHDRGEMEWVLRDSTKNEEAEGVYLTESAHQQRRLTS